MLIFLLGFLLIYIVNLINALLLAFYQLHICEYFFPIDLLTMVFFNFLFNHSADISFFKALFLALLLITKLVHIWCRKSKEHK